MRVRVVRRYSAAFKREVVEEIESGRFESIQAASDHHGIKGSMTIRGWVARLGKNHLLAKVVRVEKVGEADQMLQLRRQIERLQKALGQTQAENLLNGEYLKLACERMGEEVESFKKSPMGSDPSGDEATAVESERGAAVRDGGDDPSELLQAA